MTVETVSTDDRAYRLKDVWKGNEHFSIPFDARYGAWLSGVILGTLGTIGSAQLFVSAFRDGGPTGMVVVLAVTGVVTWLASNKIRKSGFTRWRLATVIVAGFLILQLWPLTGGSGPTGALTGLFLSVVVGVGGAIIITRTVGKQVTPTKPARYLIAVALAETRTPREAATIAHHVTPTAWVENSPPTARRVHGPTW